MLINLKKAFFVLYYFLGLLVIIISVLYFLRLNK
jgi:hypothetical protein